MKCDRVFDMFRNSSMAAELMNISMIALMKESLKSSILTSITSNHYFKKYQSHDILDIFRYIPPRYCTVSIF